MRLHKGERVKRPCSSVRKRAILPRRIRDEVLLTDEPDQLAFAFVERRQTLLVSYS